MKSNESSKLSAVERKSSGSPAGGVSTDPIKRIDKLFLKFSSAYLYSWQRMFNDKSYLDFTKKQWAEALRRFDDDMIEKAFLASCQQSKWPPSLAQFIEYCRTAESASHYSVFKPVEVKKNFHVAKTHIQKMYRMLSK